ncbi:MAG TPA: VIT domain-containing protein [Blastocatellia bacterium]|nr:VIT domain-containing protein [Blastocatellia bacterium]
MKNRLLASAGLILLLAGASFAQGIIIPRDCFQCPPIPPWPRPRPVPVVLKIKSVKVTTTIDSQVATTKVEQVFENDTPYRLEGSYFFPIPESGSISDFAIYDGDKRMAGEVVERNKARQIYNELVRKIIDPGLLEYAGKDLFQANVFPIEPRSTKKIDLAYTQVLKNEGGTVSYRYDLGSGRRLLPHPIGQIAASVEINSPVDLKNIYSPSHKISVSRDGERRARLSFEGTGEDTQRDFQLYYSLSEKDFGLSLLTHREPGKDGYFLMLISPKVEIAEAERIPKDVVFVFDTSGSMSGEKIEKAKAALRFGVESLADRDRFNIVSFSGEEHLLKAGMAAADRAAKRDAQTFIDRLRAEGGTNINDSLAAALRQFHESDRTALIVFMTDGLPTVGTTDVKQILKNIADANRARVRIFSFGVGYDVNTSLLDKISAENRGASDYIEPKEDLEVKLSNFFAKVNYPVLSDLRLDFGGVETELSYPRSLPDLFRGSQLTIVGRYKNAASDATLRLTGKVGARAASFSFSSQRFPAERSDNQFLPRLWATRRVGDLLEQIRLNGANRELIDEIVALGTRYGIVTPYTSFLVTEDVKQAAGRAAPGAAPLRAIQGMAQSNIGLASGEGAVMRSRAEKEMKESDSAGGMDRYLGNIELVDGKSFMLKDGVWVDTEYRDDRRMSKVEVKFGSDEYFALIAREPRLAEFFAIGRKVIVVLNNRVYQVD